MPSADVLLHQWVCDLCGQPLAGPDDRCNSGIHQGPDDLNGWRGKAIDEQTYNEREHARSYRSVPTEVR